MTNSTAASRSSRSNLEWLARSMGFVDKVCCYSYAKNQIYEEDMSIRNANSYDSEEGTHCAWHGGIHNDDNDNNDDDDLIVSSTMKKKSTENYNGQRMPSRKGKFSAFPNSPGRSMETATTVTTSTCTTIPTSVIKKGSSTDMESQQYPHPSPSRQPQEISIPTFLRHLSMEEMDASILQHRDTHRSSSLPSTRFYAATEGYEG